MTPVFFVPAQNTHYLHLSSLAHTTPQTSLVFLYYCLKPPGLPGQAVTFLFGYLRSIQSTRSPVSEAASKEGPLLDHFWAPTSCTSDEIFITLSAGQRAARSIEKSRFEGARKDAAFLRRHAISQFIQNKFELHTNCPCGEEGGIVSPYIYFWYSHLEGWDSSDTREWKPPGRMRMVLFRNVGD